MIQGVIFDLGETLIHFEGDWEQVFEQARHALIEALEVRGLDLDRGEFSERFRGKVEWAHSIREDDYTERPGEDLLRETLAEFGHEQVDPGVVRTAVDRMYAVSQEHWIPVEGAQQVVRQLEDRGYHLGMISNASDVADVHRLVDKVGVRSHLDPILVSAGVGVRKPAPEIFQHVLREWGLPAEVVVMVGDTLNADVLGAQKVGMHQIWLRTSVDRDDNQENMGEIKPEVTADHITEVPDLIEDRVRWTQGV